MLKHCVIGLGGAGQNVVTSLGEFSQENILLMILNTDKRIQETSVPIESYYLGEGTLDVRSKKTVSEAITKVMPIN